MMKFVFKMMEFVFKMMNYLAAPVRDNTTGVLSGEDSTCSRLLSQPSPSGGGDECSPASGEKTVRPIRG